MNHLEQENSPKLDPRKARQGYRGRTVLFVLIASLFLALGYMIAAGVFAGITG